MVKDPPRDAPIPFFQNWIDLIRFQKFRVSADTVFLINVEFLYISVLCVKHNLLNIDNFILKKNKLKIYKQNLWQKY